MAIDLFMSVSPKGVSRYHLTSLNKRWFIWYSSRYRNVYFHKRMQEYDQVPVLPAYMSCLETKNTWARDDPAILVLIGACLCGMFRIYIFFIFV